MQINKEHVKRILVITLSNVGDIILTTPVVRALRKEFPGSRIDVMVGPRGKEIFERDPSVFKLIIYDKHLPISQKRRLQLKLKKLRYDLIVDIRNTIFPLLIGPKFRTATIQHFPHHVVHSRQKHLYRLQSLGIDNLGEQSYIHITPADEEYVDGLLRERGIDGPFVVVNAGARSHLKRWTIDGFALFADKIASGCNTAVIFVGGAEDEEVVSGIIKKMKHAHHNLVNKTNIRQLAQLIKRAQLLVTNDSAPLHIGCAVGTKVLALFGPTDPKKYGPTGEFDVIIHKKLSCSPCEKAECVLNLECMKSIGVDEVFDAAKMMIEGYEE